MASTGVKGFFREKKKGKPGAAKKSNKSASFGSDVVQPPALISHATLDLQEEYDEKEEVLRQFDMNMAYGPCIGMNRLDRWERANKFGLNPPAQVENLLRMEKANGLCLWDGRA
ncbi:hypothetical protein SASPL_115226 [Salvia splendens]|uniref:DNA polymerase delta subunit 4 n=1 Tax=Salvia splendens TaxID=180675 RepID=A0A8X8Y233_SALSN|nr:DNA polymerase delta subunit 4-like [Salvia splendens]KAG6424806.1 hypothetical protein SASPL_115226 [Salvia splendens]